MNLHLLMWTLGCAAGFVSGVVVLRARGALRVSSVVALGWAWGGLLLGAKLHYRLETMSPMDAVMILSPADVLTPGMRLPLGLLLGGVLAGLWTLAVRGPVLATGDALAVAASVAIPIGRIGCLSQGCCMGGTCSAWISPICRRFAAGTEAYTAQLHRHLIAPGDALSLPAHQLPIYFAIASLLTLAVLVVLLRRNAPSGTLLAVFCIARPVTKLMLEPLRATARPELLMLGIPSFVLFVTVIVLVACAARRRQLAPRWQSERERSVGR